MSEQVMRVFSTDLKESTVRRLEAGERLGAIALELGIRRKLLYEWRAAYRAMGVSGLNRKRGPKPAAGSASTASASAPEAGDDLARARERIAALERKIGQQQVDLDFFRKALRLPDAPEPTAGATGSTRSSTR